MSIIAAAAAGGAAGAARRRMEEQAQQQKQCQQVQLEIGGMVYSGVDLAREGIPRTSEELKERKQKLDSAEFMLKDPWNCALIAIIAEGIERKKSDAAATYSTSKAEYERRGILARTLIDPPTDPENKSYGIRLSEILNQFPALDHNHISMRLRLMEDAGLLT